MIYFIFFVAFSLALLIANIVCFVKKQYLYLFIPCMLFLPKFYAIEFSQSLPLLTVGRMMFLVFYIYAFINRRQDLKLSREAIKALPKEYTFLGAYFVLRIVSNLYYITTYGQAAKTIFEIVFEQLLLIVAFYLLAPTKKEIDKLIKVIVWVAAAMFVMGLVESFSGVRIFDALYTVSRSMLNDHYIRLGLLRSTTTLGLPGFYGNMCIILLPLILYMYETTRKRRYLAIIFLNILAVIHSGCRSDIFFYIFAVAVYFVFVLHRKERRIEALKNAAIVLVAIVAFTGALSIASAEMRYYYSGTVKSVLNEVGFDFDLDAGAPEGSEGYGVNTEGTYSRTSQLTGIIYTMGVNPVFGLGSGVENRDELYYYYYDKWRVFHTFDLGYVEVLCSEGIIGFLGYASLFIFLALVIIKRYRFGTFRGERILNCMPLFYLVCMLSTANMAYYLTLIVVLFIANSKVSHLTLVSNQK